MPVAQEHLPPTAGKVLRSRRAIAYLLPHPEETWTSRQLPPDVKPYLPALRSEAVIERVERDPATYRTVPAAYEWVREYLRDPRAVGTCVHTGVSKVGPDEYTCGKDDCSVRFSRDVAEEIVYRDD